MIRVTCTSCQKQLSLDETKLPAGPATFPCPVCKTKITVDRRKLEGAGNAAAAAVAAPAAPARIVEEDEEDEDGEHEIGDKALIVGTDSPALRHAAKMIGLQPVFQADVAAAREYYLREFPAVVFINPEKLTQPPLADFGSLLSVSPADRRRGFFILVADNLRTSDGNAAFLYGVNLIVASKDMPSFPVIYRDADAAHTRFYAAMDAAHAG